ncbi:UNVERIFIED_ORG: hypothetical protein ABIB63_003083 [Xanthomonas axonopodis]
MDIAKSPPRSFWRHQRGWLALAIGVTVLAAVGGNGARCRPRRELWIDAATRGPGQTLILQLRNPELDAALDRAHAALA